MSSTETKQHWFELKAQCPPDLAEQVANILQSLDALSVTLTDAKDQPLFQLQPEQHPLWQFTEVTALYNNEAEALQCQQLAQTLLPDSVKLAVSTLQDQDWVRETQKQFQPQAFGENADPIWVIPSWITPNDEMQPHIRIDPGLAFGTGTHPTTAMCLSWLSENPPAEAHVIDYGCGSGILAIAALALGAKKVDAIDHDPQAVEATNNNLQLNAGLNKQRLNTTLPDSSSTAAADCVIANILASPLIELSKHISELVKPNGTLVLSGVLAEEMDDVLSHYPAFKQTERKCQGEWACVSLKKKSS